jgi:hypothetical protein
MSLGTFAIGELPIAAQVSAAIRTTKPPRKRVTVAKSDTVTQPEPR